MKESIVSEYEYTNLKYTGNLKLNNYEKIVYNSVVKHDDIEVSFDDIIGHIKAKQTIENIVIKPLQSKEKQKFNPPNGLILHGPPGTGKTMLVKALCKKLKINFILFEQSFIEQKMFGESAKVIKAMFSLASKLKPCVIFIDEIDGVFGQRTASEQSFVTGLKTQILTQMDGFVSHDPSIIFVGATNRLSSLDPALLRRMRTHIHIPLPNKDERIELFRHYMNNDDDYTEISKQTEGYSGSDIYELCKLSYYNNCDLQGCLDLM